MVATLGVVSGCLRFEPFRCEGDGDCVFDGRPGQCRLAEQVCVYPDSSCSTQWSAADGECMPPASGDSSTGAEASGTGETDGPPPCGLQPRTLVAEGTVWASSVYEDMEGVQYPESLAVDGDYGTSWLSAGSGLTESTPSLFRWTSDEPRCIARVAVISNAMHEQQEFRRNYGFGGIIIRVYDERDEIAFQRMFSLPGTPDPDAIAEPGVEGVKVELELFDHEVFFSGGFSELEIDGT